MTDAAPWIDPQLVAMGDWQKARGLSSLSPVTSPLADCRVMLERIGAALNADSKPLKRERDIAVPATHGSIPCRLYLPDHAERPPLLVYAHGGSFALGTLAAWDQMLRDLVRHSGVAVLSVDYRLAPEHRFPTACDDMLAVVRHVARRGSELDIDPARLAAGGDSAGANLALGAALALRDANDRALSFLLLIYGVYSMNIASDSWRRLGAGNYGLSVAQMKWIGENYLERSDQVCDWRFSLLKARMHGLPAAHLIVGSLDPLQDDNHALAAQFAAAGVAHRLQTYAGLTHGFIRYGNLIATVDRAVSDCAAALAAAFASGSAAPG